MSQEAPEKASSMRSVKHLERGKRFNAEDFPKTNWNARKYLWLPQLGCYGYQMLTQLKHVLIFHGGGVGGGGDAGQRGARALVDRDEVGRDIRGHVVGLRFNHRQSGQ